MSSASPPVKTANPLAHEPSALGGLLSYLVPGLGQIYQGRVAKGVLFLVCLYGLFFYGMYLGSWSNVYLRPVGNRGAISSVFDRLSFAGQFFIGAAAWPAVWQYNEMPLEWVPRDWRGFMKTPPEGRLNDLQSEGDKFWDLGQIYTVIAGVLNILVIYDAYAGPAFAEAESEGSRRRDNEEAEAA